MGTRVPRFYKDPVPPGEARISDPRDFIIPQSWRPWAGRRMDTRLVQAPAWPVRREGVRNISLSINIRRVGGSALCGPHLFHKDGGSWDMRGWCAFILSWPRRKHGTLRAGSKENTAHHDFARQKTTTPAPEETGLATPGSAQHRKERAAKLGGRPKTAAC